MSMEQIKHGHFKGADETGKMLPIIGKIYSWDEVKKCGGEETFLGKRGNKIVCATLDEQKNPEAPEIMVVGDKAKNRKRAEEFCEQKGQIPIFIKESINKWRYYGRYEFEKYTEDSEVIKKHENQANGSLTRIIFLKPAEGQVVEEIRENVINKKNTGSEWGKLELKASIEAYLKMIQLEQRGEKFNKSIIYQGLAKQYGRSAKSIEYRMQNISFVLSLAGRNIVTGLAPARNVGTNVLAKIEDILAEMECRAPDAEITFNAEVSRLKGRVQKHLPQGTKSPFRKNVASTGYVRSPEVVAWVLSNSNGKCEGCGKNGPFITNTDEFYLEVHHVHFLSEGGPDTIENAVAVCANCHRAFHYSKDRIKLTKELYKNTKRLVKNK